MNQNSKRQRHLRIAGRILYCFLLQLVCILIFSFLLIYHSPFTKLRDSIVVTAMNTNAQKYWATWFLSHSEIDNILKKANPVVATAAQDLSEIKVTTSSPGGLNVTSTGGISIIDLSEKNFKGKLMIISNPSKITVGIAPDIGHSGDRLSQIAAAYGAIGGVNAGGFLDDNFIQNGALPSGIVISAGQIKSQQDNMKKFDIIGFNNDNILVIANSLTLETIKALYLRCAVSFGPALVVNGNSMVTYGGTSLQPRTVIGQRKDGTVLLMVIDGRQSTSAGATYKMEADEMLKYGAYNAANLDGGSSTTMFFNHKIINSPCDILGERSISTAFLVMP